MRFLANSVMNAQGFTFEAMDGILSLYEYLVYIWGIFTLDVK